MSDPADRYCSDCAWPYECADAESCHRRDMGEVRGENLRLKAGQAVASIKTESGWTVLGKVHGPRQDVAQIPLPRENVEFTATMTAEGLDALRDWHRRAREAMAEALHVSADQLIAEARRPHPDAVLAYLFGALVPPRSRIQKIWLDGRPVSRRQLALVHWLRKLTEIDGPLLIGYDLAEAPA